MINAAIAGLGRWGQRLVDSVQGEGVTPGTLLRFCHGTTRRKAKAGAFAAKRDIAPTDSHVALLAAGLQARIVRLRHARH